MINLNSFSLKSKVAIVTAAGRGIGKSTALGFAGVGANVVLADIKTDSLNATYEEVCQLGQEALMVVGDMTKENDVSNLVNQAVKRFGKVDILASVVGGHSMEQRAPALEMSGTVWDAVVELNLKTAFLSNREVAKAMIAQKIKGSIINIASYAGITSYPRSCHYGAAKAGVIHLTKSLAAAWGNYGIRVNCIAPSTIDTPMFGEARTYLKVDLEELEKTIPLGRIGRPDDIATAAIFFASNASDYVTGQTLVVSGGIEYFG
ncbi:SDR family NAD(P)-dependent oxidoreductase [Chloroflexota bacterium]